MIPAAYALNYTTSSCAPAEVREERDGRASAELRMQALELETCNARQVTESARAHSYYVNKTLL